MTGDPLDTPIDRGDTLVWDDGTTVEIRDFYISEDGVVQVRIREGRDSKRTLTADDIVSAVADGRLNQR